MAKDFNWDDFETVNPNPEVSQDSSFDWNQFEPVEQEKRDLASIVDQEKQNQGSTDISEARAALIGAGQGATLGFGEEITAPFVAAAGMIGGVISPEQKIPNLPGEEGLVGTLEKFQRLMQTYRDVGREEQQAAQEQQPGSYMAGQLAGGLVAPGLGTAKALKTVKDAGLSTKTAMGATAGAALGGLAGAGEAEGSLQERLPEAIEGAQTGAVVGGAIPVTGAIGTTGKKALGAIAEGLGLKPVSEAFEEGVKGISLVSEKARREATSLGRQKAKELYQDIRNSLNTIGKKIGNEISSATKEGKTVDISDETKSVLDKLNKIVNKNPASDEAKQAQQIIQDIRSTLQMDINLEKAPDQLSGLVTPVKKVDQLKSVSPDTAQELKKILQKKYPTQPGMESFKVAPYEEAQAFAGRAQKVDQVTGELIPGKGIGEKLAGVTKNLPELNKQYGLMKGALERLKINEGDLPNQIRDKINKIINKIEKQNLTGDDAREILKDVKTALSQIDPNIAQKYGPELEEIVKRSDLADQIIKGGQSFSLAGTPKAIAMRIGNVAGLAAGKTGIAKAASTTKNVADAVLSAPQTKKSLAISSDVREMAEPLTSAGLKVSGLEPIKGQEFHKQNKRIASAAENADPEVLSNQAQQIRSQYGQQGEQLATILDNMAQKDKDARRALMFTILQNPAHRKMLGMGEE